MHLWDNRQSVVGRGDRRICIFSIEPSKILFVTVQRMENLNTVCGCIDDMNRDRMAMLFIDENCNI